MRFENVRCLKLITLLQCSDEAKQQKCHLSRKTLKDPERTPKDIRGTFNKGHLNIKGPVRTLEILTLQKKRNNYYSLI